MQHRLISDADDSEIERGASRSQETARSASGDELGLGRMLDSHREIKALVDNFVADLSELAKRIAIEHLKAAFAAGTQVATPPPRPAPAPRSRARRGQREIAALQGKLLATIAE